MGTHVSLLLLQMLVFWDQEEHNTRGRKETRCLGRVAFLTSCLLCSP